MRHYVKAAANKLSYMPFSILLSSVVGGDVVITCPRSATWL